MDEEIEDIIGEVRYTDSQKSVTASCVTIHMPQSLTQSPDFTDSSSDRNNSSGKETYVIECDSEEEAVFPLRDSKSIVNLKEKNRKQLTQKLSSHSTTISKNMTIKSATTIQSSFTQEPPESEIMSAKSNCTSFKSSIVAQEIYTQTSKTIIELAQNEGALLRPEQNTLETQTSILSIIENKTVEYRTEFARKKSNDDPDPVADSNMCGDTMEQMKPTFFNIICNRYTESFDLDDASSKFPASETEIEENPLDISANFDDNDNEDHPHYIFANYDDNNNMDNKSDISSIEQVIRIIDDDSHENMLTGDESRENMMTECYDHRSESTTEQDCDSDMEEDSLKVLSNSATSNKDIQELHEKLNESVDLCRERYGEPDLKRFGTLTPLTEESNHKRDSLMDITPFDNIIETDTKHDEVLFTNNAGMRVKLLKDDEIKDFKLPPIHNQSCPSSPQLNSLFSNKLNKLYKAGTLPCLHGRTKEGAMDRWEIATKDLASGEGSIINAGNDAPRKLLLPPIHTEGSTLSSRTDPTPRGQHSTQLPADCKAEPISIRGKIKELKSNGRKGWNNATKYNRVSRPESQSRSPSPSNFSTNDEQHRLSEVAEKGCEVLVSEMIRRLRSTCWFDIIETLEEMPRVMDKFWGVISEQRTADLMRLMNGLIESPRPQVSRAACATLATVLKNTAYTKKPEFFESINVLLSKTGSYSQALRRSANVALDEAVCALPSAAAVQALCLYGAEHKHPLVRCAAARLIVVCCALAGGGRELLRIRPSTAVTARRLALRALSLLLEDKSTDTRKYAERLYTMLRPLKDFEAFYLTDVDVETAARQMKKYDQLLMHSAIEGR